MKSEEILNCLRDEIVRTANPRRILLFSHKQSPAGELQSVKLCVIINDGDSRQVEQRLYVEIESELAFDVLVYTVGEWKKLLENKMSFATHIQEIGRVLYEVD
ncbi:MAG: hypothetical protein GX136_06555 [Clostridiales bacterium]|jgi:hypothetical protein|nr:hypothetical protein [Clostridiales bacterium]